jgi:hypothetical protein
MGFSALSATASGGPAQLCEQIHGKDWLSKDLETISLRPCVVQQIGGCGLA